MFLSESSSFILFIVSSFFSFLHKRTRCSYLCIKNMKTKRPTLTSANCPYYLEDRPVRDVRFQWAQVSLSRSTSTMKNSSLAYFIVRSNIANKFRAIRKRIRRIYYCVIDYRSIFFIRIKLKIIKIFFRSFDRKHFGESVEQNWPRWHREKMYIQRWIDHRWRGESCGESSIGSTWIWFFERRIGSFEGHLSSPWCDHGSKDESWLRWL